MHKISISSKLKTGLLHGADYNPDQWKLDPAILDEDFKLMQATKCTSMSIGIFSWTQYEPEEGIFQFGWMDTIMDRMAKEGMHAFLATPSGSKPMWMQHKYPEIRRVMESGQREPVGFRHNHCPSSPLYREKVRTLNEKLAERYADHPALALWHVGNELQGECYCENCLSGFRNWLKEKYKTLDAINQAWWSGFWNHTLTDWNQIDPRDPSVDGMLLDWKRYINTLHVSFLENEIAPLRQHTPNIPCTTNFMLGSAPLLNYGEWSKALDVISNDAYPCYFGATASGDDSIMLKRAARFAFTHDLSRAMNDGKPWMLLECSPSMVNWAGVNKLKPKDVHKLEAAQAVAHGADTVHYFQWRKGRGGFEKFHGAVIDHDPRTDTRVFKEVTDTGTFLREHGDLAQSVSSENSTAILYDWESQWAMNTSCGIKQPEQNNDSITEVDAFDKLIYDHYRGAREAGLGIDAVVVHPEGLPDLSKYKLIIAPATYLIRSNAAEALLQYVEQGATLILSHFSGVVDEFNRVHRHGLPGLNLHHAAGVKVEEVDSLYASEKIELKFQPEFADSFQGDYKITDSYGCLHLTGASTFALYATGPWKGTSALSYQKHGKGMIWMAPANYCDDFYRDFYKFLTRDHRIPRVLETDLPLGVTATNRIDARTEKEFLFIMNFSSQKQSISLPKDASYTMKADNKTVQEVALGAHQVDVLERVRG